MFRFFLFFSNRKVASGERQATSITGINGLGEVNPSIYGVAEGNIEIGGKQNVNGLTRDQSLSDL